MTQIFESFESFFKTLLQEKTASAIEASKKSRCKYLNGNFDQDIDCEPEEDISRLQRRYNRLKTKPMKQTRRKSKSRAVSKLVHLNSETGERSIEKVRLTDADFERYRKYARTQLGTLKRPVDVRALKRIRPLPEFVTRDL